MSESMEHLREKFLKWKEALESKGLKANLKKTKVLVRGLCSRAKSIYVTGAARGR